jgi:hypothetical protein
MYIQNIANKVCVCIEKHASAGLKPQTKHGILNFSRELFWNVWIAGLVALVARKEEYSGAGKQLRAV